MIIKALKTLNLIAFITFCMSYSLHSQSQVIVTVRKYDYPLPVLIYEWPGINPPIVLTCQIFKKSPKLSGDKTEKSLSG